MFALDADFGVVAGRLIRLQDGSEPDIAVSQGEVEECLEILDCLFHEGLCFSAEPNGTYTSALVQGIVAAVKRNCTSAVWQARLRGLKPWFGLAIQSPLYKSSEGMVASISPWRRHSSTSIIPTIHGE